jgi:hypothetical protein
MPLPTPPSTRTIQPQPIRQTLMPALAFPSIWWTQGPLPAGTVDSATFPGRHDQACRKDRRHCVGAAAFIMALRTARLLRIVDPKFDAQDGAEPLEQALDRSSVLSVRLLTGRCSEAEQWCIRVRRLLASRGGSVAPDVQWKTSLEVAPVLDVHDRFAIVDDELWHFGATVGGAHRSVNAFSRGWDAKTTRASEFFEEAWKHA